MRFDLKRSPPAFQLSSAQKLSTSIWFYFIWSTNWRGISITKPELEALSTSLHVRERQHGPFGLAPGRVAAAGCCWSICWVCEWVLWGGLDSVAAGWGQGMQFTLLQIQSPIARPRNSGWIKAQEYGPTPLPLIFCLRSKGPISFDHAKGGSYSRWWTPDWGEDTSSSGAGQGESSWGLCLSAEPFCWESLFPDR